MYFINRNPPVPCRIWEVSETSTSERTHLCSNLSVWGFYGRTAEGDAAQWRTWTRRRTTPFQSDPVPALKCIWSRPSGGACKNCSTEQEAQRLCIRKERDSGTKTKEGGWIMEIWGVISLTIQTCINNTYCGGVVTEGSRLAFGLMVLVGDFFQQDKQ